MKANFTEGGPAKKSTPSGSKAADEGRGEGREEHVGLVKAVGDDEEVELVGAREGRRDAGADLELSRGGGAGRGIDSTMSYEVKENVESVPNVLVDSSFDLGRGRGGRGGRGELPPLAELPREEDHLEKTALADRLTFPDGEASISLLFPFPFQASFNSSELSCGDADLALPLSELDLEGRPAIATISLGTPTLVSSSTRALVILSSSTPIDSVLPLGAELKLSTPPRGMKSGGSAESMRCEWWRAGRAGRAEG